MPSGFKLVVKEHQGSIGRRRLSDYIDIKKNWNVLLVGPQEDSIELVKKSKAIVTITSTVGLQGLLLRKPVVTLARVSYDASPAVIRASEIPKISLYKAIAKAINSEVKESDVLDFCIAVERKLPNSEGLILNLPIYQKEVLEEENVNKISKIIIKELKGSSN